MSFSLRTAIVSTSAAIAFLACGPALAAGSVTITQSSPIGLMGDYIIVLPDGTQQTVHDQANKEIAVAPAGTYVIRITPPASAYLLVTVIKNGLEQAATVSREVTFTVIDGEEVKVTIEYKYEGVLNVESDPEGASFELLGPNDLRDTGTTPATYTNMAPGAYRVTFHKREGCNLVSPMQRSLNPNQNLTLIGKFLCGVALPPAPAPVTPEEPVADINEGRLLRIWATANQAEVLPGGTARVSITVKNTGTRTVHDLSVSAQADSTLLQMATPLPHFGSLQADTAVWEVPQLYAGKTWTVTVPFTVSKTLSQGDRLMVTARASGTDLAEGSAETLLSSAEIGVTTLPQTGFRFDILFVIISFAAAALLAKQTVRSLAKEQA